MGGFDPASVALMVGSKVGDAVAQRQQAKAAADAQTQQQGLQAQMLWQQHNQRAKQQRDLLKRQMATARASLAGGGIGFGGGSGAALMAGMTRQVEEDIADSQAATGLRHELQFGRQEDRDSGQGLQQGLALAQQAYGVLRPMFGR